MFMYIAMYIFGFVLGSFYTLVGMKIPVGDPVFGIRYRMYKSLISPMFLWSEGITGGLFALALISIGLKLKLAVGLLGISVFVIIAVSDLLYHRIPNVILYPSIVILLIVRIWTHPLGLWSYLFGAFAGFIALFIIAVVSKGGMGFGDVKLFVFVGLYNGFAGTLLTLFLASLLGTAIGLILRMTGKLRPKQAFPFGPAIGLASIISFLYGSYWIHMYLQSL